MGPFAVAGRVRLTSVRIFRSIFVHFLTSSASQTPAAVMANFGDLKSDGGLNKLNGFLSSKSYIEGFVYSSADDKTFGQLAKCPDAKKHPHAARWYRHIQSWKDGGDGSAVAKKEATPASADDDDDVDLFGSDDEEEESAEAKRVREERLAAYHAKKSKKPALIAKTSVLLDCKPWDDETDMNKMLKEIKTIQMDGLVWGASKLVPVGYGINKLQIICVVEDEKVSIDELQEKITDIEDYVQSCDVAAVNKI